MIRFLTLLLLTTLVAQSAPTNVIPRDARVSKGFSGSHYRNRTILQSTVSGSGATPLSGSEVLVNQFLMKTYRDGDTNQVQLITRAPECNFDLESGAVSSSNRLQVFTPSTNFFIEGRGFLCVQSNYFLVISNDVATQLPKPSTNANLQTQVAKTSLTSTNPSDRLLIYSDRFEMHYDSNLVIYSGHVRVVDEDTLLRCDHLIAVFNTNRYDTNTTIERITAQDNVSITMPKGLATGDRAVYTLVNGNELLELSGHATWDDGDRQGKADKFTFDRSRRRLKADGNTAFLFPNSSLDQTNLTESAVKTVDTNKLSELFADHVTVQLLPTNAVESILAEGSVMITNRFDHSRATAQRGFYNKLTDQFELTGNPICEMQDKGEIRGNVLSFGRTSQVFSARGDAQATVRLPERHPGQKAGALFPSATNLFLRISSQQIDYKTNLATFTQNVHTELLQGPLLLGTMDCGVLTISFDSSNGATNHVDTITARDHVVVNQAAMLLVLKRSLSCDTLTARFWPGTNMLQSAVADGNVRVENLGVKFWPGRKATTNGSVRADTFATNLMKLSAGKVTAQFSSLTNDVEKVVAERNVLGLQVLEGKTNRLSGQRAVYTKSTNEILQLMGNPQILYTRATNAVVTTTNRFDFSAPARVWAFGSDILTWDLKTMESYGTGGQYQFKIVSPTNDPIATQP